MREGIQTEPGEAGFGAETINWRIIVLCFLMWKRVESSPWWPSKILHACKCWVSPGEQWLLAEQCTPQGKCHGLVHTQHWRQCSSVHFPLGNPTNLLLPTGWCPVSQTSCDHFNSPSSKAVITKLWGILFLYFLMCVLQVELGTHPRKHWAELGWS